MENVIGFASQYYTLWTYQKEDKYTTDAYGNHHKSGVVHRYFYEKNISKDIEKVRILFPNVDIDKNLRGKTRDFSYEETIELPSGIFWFGKYQGKTVDNIIESDLNYCLWVADNTNSLPLREYIKKHPKYIKHFEDIDAAEKAKIESVPMLKVGEEVEVIFITNGVDSYFSDNGRYDYIEVVCTNLVHKTRDSDGHEWSYYAHELPGDRCRVYGRVGDLIVIVENMQFKRVEGKYPYLMPVIGKAQKTKNKTFRLKVEKAFEPYIHQDGVHQRITICL